MSGRIFISLTLLSAAVYADEGNMQQLLELMESGNTAAEESPAAEPPAKAEDEAPEGVIPAGPLDLSQAIALAHTNDARLAPYTTALRLAQYRSDASLQRDNPELRLGTDIDSDEPDLRASVRFFPLHPWEANALKRENQALFEEEAAAYQSALLETTLDVATAYYELQCLEKELALYDRLSLVRRQSADLADRQVKAAVLTQAQGLLTHWEVQESLESRRNTRIKVNQIKQSLSALTGQPVQDVHVAPLDEKRGLELLDTEGATHAALSSWPELQSLRAQRSAADARLRGTKAASIPWLNHVEVGYRNNDRGWAVEAALDLPFFTIGGTDKMLAYEELALRNIEVDTQEQMLRIQVHAATRAYNAAVQEWNTLQTGQMALMEKTRAYLDATPGGSPQQAEDRMALEEKLIRAELKMLDVRRSVHATLMDLIALVGKPI